VCWQSNAKPPRATRNPEELDEHGSRHRSSNALRSQAEFCLAFPRSRPSSLSRVGRLCVCCLSFWLKSMRTTGAMTERPSISRVHSASFSVHEHHERNRFLDEVLSLRLHSIRLGTTNCCPLTCSLPKRPGCVGKISTLEVRIRVRSIRARTAEATRPCGATAG
jgi:hypothetical protein